MDLKRLSQDTLIHIITDLQKQNDKLKEENDEDVNNFKNIQEEIDKLKEEIDKLKEEIGKLKKEINKLKEEIDINKIYINEISRKLSLQPIIEKKDAQTITDNSNVMSFYDELKIYDCNVWYMNGNLEDIDKWDIFVNNNFVKTWNPAGQNEKIKTKIKKGDIIAWYIVSRGYNSILKVIDNPKVITDRELILLYNDKEERKEIKDDIEKGNYESIIIPVEFLVTTTTNFVTKNDIPYYNKKWTYGLRGSHCQSPNNPDWNEQVIEMYNYLNEIN